jgi:hypothetical protein
VVYVITRYTAAFNLRLLRSLFVVSTPAHAVLEYEQVSEAAADLKTSLGLHHASVSASWLYMS